MKIKKYKVGNHDFSMVDNPAWDEYDDIIHIFTEEVRYKFKDKPFMGLTTGPIITIPNDEKWIPLREAKLLDDFYNHNLYNDDNTREKQKRIGRHAKADSKRKRKGEDQTC